MGKRREGREAALQFLFSHDLNKAPDKAEQEAFWELRRASPSVRAFAEEIVRGVIAHREEVDACLAASLDHSTPAELPPVERNLLRTAIFELLFLEEIPSAVTINEAIEIAKRFGGTESARFINGVLDRIRREREARTN